MKSQDVLTLGPTGLGANGISDTTDANIGRRQTNVQEQTCNDK